MTDGCCRSRMPDYFLRAADGDGIVVDIKPDELIDANDRIDFAATAALCVTRSAGPFDDSVGFPR